MIGPRTKSLQRSAEKAIKAVPVEWREEQAGLLELLARELSECAAAMRSGEVNCFAPLSPDSEKILTALVVGRVEAERIVLEAFTADKAERS